MYVARCLNNSTLCRSFFTLLKDQRHGKRPPKPAAPVLPSERPLTRKAGPPNPFLQVTSCPPNPSSHYTASRLPISHPLWLEPPTTNQWCCSSALLKPQSKLVMHLCSLRTRVLHDPGLGMGAPDHTLATPAPDMCGSPPPPPRGGVSRWDRTRGNGARAGFSLGPGILAGERTL